jgi:hypothetical protein
MVAAASDDEMVRIWSLGRSHSNFNSKENGEQTVPQGCLVPSKGIVQAAADQNDTCSQAASPPRHQTVRTELPATPATPAEQRSQISFLPSSTVGTPLRASAQNKRPLVQIKVTQAFMNAAKLVEPSLPDQIVMECSA